MPEDGRRTRIMAAVSSEDATAGADELVLHGTTAEHLGGLAQSFSETP